MIISPHPQNSVEWLQARAGIVTASEMDALVSPTGKVKKGDAVETYLNKKLAEWWTGGPIETGQSFWMEQGQILEEEALPWYAFKYNVEPQRVGLITTDDGFVGCSPDGLLDGAGIEIKCPSSPVHIGYLRNGVLPADYVHQVQAGLYVTGFPAWKFVSYRRGMPNLVLTIAPNDDFQEAIGEAVAEFRERLEAEKQRLIEMNGGPPKRFAAPAPKSVYQSDPNDLMP